MGSSVKRAEKEQMVTRCGLVFKPKIIFITNMKMQVAVRVTALIVEYHK